MSKRSDAEAIRWLVSAMNEDETAVLLKVAERLHDGRTTYGALNLETDKRDFLEEAMMEILDLAAYSAMALLPLGRNQP